VTPVFRFALLLAAVAAVSFLRDPGAFLRPILAFEDGRDILGFFYHRRGIETWLRTYAGYVVLVPNLLGWAALAAPIRAAPHLLAAGPLALSSLAFAWLARRPYRWLLASDDARFAACVLLALAPVANARFVGNTMYAVWSAFLLLVLWALAPPPRSGAAAAARLLAMSLLAWSHPLSVLLVPVWLLQALFPGRLAPGAAAPLARLFYAELAAAALLYQLFGVDHAALSALPPQELLHRTAALTLVRVVFGAVFGDAAAHALRAAGAGALIPAAALAVLAAAGLALARARARIGVREAFALALLGWVILGATALAVLGRQADYELLLTHQEARFFWVQRILFLVLLVLGAGLLAEARRAAGAPPTPAASPGPAAPSAPALRMRAQALLAAWLVLLNLANNAVYRVSPAEGEQVHAFVAAVAREEEARGGRAQVRARLERGPWSIALEP
jgi:hypothetical protein